MKKGIILIFLLSASHICSSQADEHLVKALYLLDITKNTAFVERPTEAYTITVIGSSPVFNVLQHHTANIHILGLPVKLVQIDDVARLEPSQMVYLSEEKSKLLGALLQQTAHEPVVIVGERPGLYKAGAAFSFVMSDNKKWQVDVNKVSLADRGIGLSKNLNEIFHQE